MAKKGKIIVEIDLDDKSVKATERKTKRLRASFKGMGKSFLGAGKLMAGGLAIVGAALAAVTVKTAKSVDQIGKLSKRLGISTEALSQLQFVAERGGVSIEGLNVGLQRMSRRVGEAANGSKPLIEAFAALGLDANKLVEMAPDKQFEAIAESLSKVENSSIRTSQAFKIFDTEGVGLLQTMGEGAAGIREMRLEADRLGLTISQDTANAAAEMNDAMTNAAAGLKGLFLQAGGLEVMQTLANVLQTVTGWLIELRQELAPSLQLIRDFNIVGLLSANIRKFFISIRVAGLALTSYFLQFRLGWIAITDGIENFIKDAVVFIIRNFNVMRIELLEIRRAFLKTANTIEGIFSDVDTSGIDKLTAKINRLKKQNEDFNKSAGELQQKRLAEDQKFYDKQIELLDENNAKRVELTATGETAVAEARMEARKRVLQAQVREGNITAERGQEVANQLGIEGFGEEEETAGGGFGAGGGDFTPPMAAGGSGSGSDLDQAQIEEGRAFAMSMGIDPSQLTPEGLEQLGETLKTRQEIFKEHQEGLLTDAAEAQNEQLEMQRKFESILTGVNEAGAKDRIKTAQGLTDFLISDMGIRSKKLFAIQKALAIATAISNIQESLSGGVSSAMQLPFPANLAALATNLAVIATNTIGIISTIKGTSLQGAQAGGLVGGVDMGRDSVPLMTQPGEMVIPRGMVKPLMPSFAQAVDNMRENGEGDNMGGGKVKVEVGFRDRSAAKFLTLRQREGRDLGTIED